MTDKELVTKHFRRVRIRKGYTTMRLSRELGNRQASISEFELGKRYWLHIGKLIDWLETLGVKPSQFFAEIGK